jgi:hypothetical protein|tara:strand:- start:9658 stop:9963 length:306 start_codon:yes stop_codon:yes gene_type:complete
MTNRLIRKVIAGAILSSAAGLGAYSITDINSRVDPENTNGNEFCYVNEVDAPDVITTADFGDCYRVIINNRSSFPTVVRPLKYRGKELEDLYLVNEDLFEP